MLDLSQNTSQFNPLEAGARFFPLSDMVPNPCARCHTDTVGTDDFASEDSPKTGTTQTERNVKAMRTCTCALAEHPDTLLIPVFAKQTPALKACVKIVKPLHQKINVEGDEFGSGSACKINTRSCKRVRAHMFQL